MHQQSCCLYLEILPDNTNILLLDCNKQFVTVDTTSCNKLVYIDASPVLSNVKIYQKTQHSNKDTLEEGKTGSANSPHKPSDADLPSEGCPTQLIVWRESVVPYKLNSDTDTHPHSENPPTRARTLPTVHGNQILSAEHFLWQYNQTKADRSQNESPARPGPPQPSQVEYMKACFSGKQLDSLFGLDAKKMTCEEAGSLHSDSFYSLTETLQDYLKTASQSLSHLVTTGGVSNAHDDGPVASTQNGLGGPITSTQNGLGCPITSTQNGLGRPVTSTQNTDSHTLEQSSTTRYSFGTAHPEVIAPSVSPLESDLGSAFDILCGDGRVGECFSESFVYCGPGEGNSTQSSKDSEKSHLPTGDQLQQLQDFLVTELPKILFKTPDYRIYRKDVVLENNMAKKPYVTKPGIQYYSMQLLRLKLYISWRYVNCGLTPLKSTTHEEDGTIRIRWQFHGLPQLKLLKFWTFLPWNYSNSKKKESEYVDGISTFSVDRDGFIYRHTVDRVLPDDHKVVEPKSTLVDNLRRLAARGAPAAT